MDKKRNILGILILLGFVLLCDILILIGIMTGFFQSIDRSNEVVSSSEPIWCQMGVDEYPDMGQIKYNDEFYIRSSDVKEKYLKHNLEYHHDHHNEIRISGND